MESNSHNAINLLIGTLMCCRNKHSVVNLALRFQQGSLNIVFLARHYSHVFLRNVQLINLRARV